MSDESATPIAVAVVVCGDAVLVGRRPVGVALAGLWEFPGGKIEQGESPENAACRECLEETGLAIEVTGTLDSRVHAYDHGTVHLHFFACCVSGAHTDPRPPFRWVKCAELDEYEFPAANKKVVGQLLCKKSNAR